ncbi:MarR family transcriptional regulator [Halorhabdus sp. CBA1104]|uniref:MarR family winged helix-turn-helix transcriptional regulator n=1 Tax=unclassified Halorhabdus TaxID=2621901 RepID=UPI0012B356C8|nr:MULTISPECIES: MarR family transcriptional regulator [unclassified Halorhabdus]QGN06926.1 MarR family transcriptional regulator [Halorhabdus sp. CBA1104]
MSDREFIAWHVSLAGRALSRTIEDELSAYDLGRGEYRVLFALTEREGVTQTDLVEKHHLEKSSIARVVAQLESKGYVETRPDPEDRRRKRLYLTEAGRDLREEVTAVKDRVDSQLTDGLSPTEETRLVEYLRTVCRNLDVALPEDES